MDDAQPPKRSISGERSKGSLVLLVEDEYDLRNAIAEVLTQEGFRVIEARDGHAAVVKALAYLPAIIVMDIALPLMDGARVARVLRSNVRTATVPLIAFTGTLLDARDRRAFDALVPKPCAPEVLVHTVRWILAGRDRKAGR